LRAVPQVNKGRNSSTVQRFLYLSPTNKQVVWATKATSKGKLSKKGLTLDNITELHCEDGCVRVEAVSASVLEYCGVYLLREVAPRRDPRGSRYCQPSRAFWKAQKSHSCSTLLDGAAATVEPLSIVSIVFLTSISEPSQKGESTPLILKSAAVDSLTSEGATILLGVLLADMTGTMLRLQGVNGGSGSCYYPASFVNEVLE